MFTFAQKYSMSGRAETSILPVNIFPITSECPSRSSAVLLAVVVIMGLPFLDQLTAITQKYVSTSSVSNSILISLWAISTFLHSVSRIGRLNWSISQWGLALGFVGASFSICCGFGFIFRVGLMAIGFADFTHHVVGGVMSCGGVVCFSVGWGVGVTAS